MKFKEQFDQFNETHPRTTGYVIGLTLGLTTGLTFALHMRGKYKPQRVSIIAETATNVIKWAEVEFKSGRVEYFEFIGPEILMK